MKNKESYRLPDGNFTSDAKKLARAWKNIYKPICKALGIEVIGFDPGILFRYGNNTIDLPTDIAIKIRNLITGKNETK